MRSSSSNWPRSTRSRLHSATRSGSRRERLRPERGAGGKPGEAGPPSESERGWGPASIRRRLRPERGAGGKPGEAGPPSESERGWGPASIRKVSYGKNRTSSRGRHTREKRRRGREAEENLQ